MPVWIFVFSHGINVPNQSEAGFCFELGLKSGEFTTGASHYSKRVTPRVPAVMLL